MTTEAWSAFPSEALEPTDIIVGLRAGANTQFTLAGVMFGANNLNDVADVQVAFDTISPLTTAGDTLYRDGSNNVHLAIGANTTMMTAVGGIPAWRTVAQTRTNLGLATNSDVTFASLTTSGINVDSNANALTAHAGGGQGSALQLAAAINRVTTVATAADSVKLPAAVAGKSCVVINAAAANAMNVFPASSEVINALSPNAALSVAANKTVMFFCAVNGTWNTIVTA